MSDETPDDQVEPGPQLQVEIICSGPPYCDLRGDKALRAQQGGCIWCSRVYTEPDGREIIDQPGTA